MAALTSTAHADNFQAGLAAAKKQDYATAFKNWIPLAKNGHTIAQYNLAQMYRRGQGVAVSYDKALYWYRKSANQGYPSAQLNIGNMYYYGYGVTKNYATARIWYVKAAAQGNKNARHNLKLIKP